jgi:hypothetical protein
MIRLAENKETARFENQALGFVNEMVRWSNRLEEATSPASKAHCLKKRAKYRSKAIAAFERAKKAAEAKI